jgi:ABC-type transporter Mla MlaB component
VDPLGESRSDRPAHSPAYRVQFEGAVFRITKICDDPDGLELLLEGRLTGPAASELLAICEPVLCGDRFLNLDLSGLQFADTNGRAALRSLLRRGAVASRSTVFMEELLAAK